MSFDIDELRRRLPSAKQIASDLYGVKWHGNRARCARAENHAHGDRNPSFAFLDKKDRLHCFSQLCFGERPIDVFDFVSQMEHCDFYEAATRLNEFYGAGMMRVDPKRGNVAKTLAQLKKDGWEVVAEYSMGDAVRKLRIEHPDRIQLEKGRPEKTFLWEHCAADGKWKPGRGGRPYNAYVNPLFRERDQIESVLGVESERSADAAGAVGFPAFSFKELTAENAVSFAGLAVRLLPDKDVSGQKLIQRSIEFLRPHTRGIEIIEPPEEWPEAGDLYDAIAERGWTEVQIAALLATARPAQRAALQREQRPKSIPVASQAPPELLSVADLLALDVPEAEMLIEGLIPSPGASLLFGAPKSNKTLLAIQMAIAVASGCPLFGCRSVLKPGTVLVVEQDDPAGKSTVKSILQRSSVSVEGIPFHLVPRVPFTFGRELIEWLERKIATLGLVLVVLDSYTALRSPRKSGIDIVKAEQEDLTQLDDLAKRTGSAIVVVHHDSKGSVGMEWSQKAAGTFAMSAATETQLHISRFSELDGSAPERLLRVRGRHLEGTELVLRFRKETLDHEQVMEGGAAIEYPLILQLQSIFGDRLFTPRECVEATGGSRANVHRQIERLRRAGTLKRTGYGQYVLVSRGGEIQERAETVKTIRTFAPGIIC